MWACHIQLAEQSVRHKRLQIASKSLGKRFVAFKSVFKR